MFIIYCYQEMPSDSHILFWFDCETFGLEALLAASLYYLLFLHFSFRLKYKATIFMFCQGNCMQFFSIKHDNTYIMARSVNSTHIMVMVRSV